VNSSDTVFFNGKLMPGAEAAVPAGCLAVTHGMACFETMRLVAGRSAVAYDQHLARLFRGAERLGYDAVKHSDRLSPLRITAGILALAEKSGSGSDLRIRVQTGRADRGGLAGGREPEFFLLITAEPAAEEGGSLSLRTSLRTRIAPSALENDVKWSFYYPSRAELAGSRESGFDEALFTDADGNACCTAAGNIFVIHNGVITTPDLRGGALHGITRNQLMQAMEAHGNPVIEREISMQELKAAEALLVSSSVRGLTAVSRLDDRRLRTDHPLANEAAEAFSSHRRSTLQKLSL
jgi:branched-chain amino acid aminotransferase